MHWPWFLNCGKFFQPPFLHWFLLVGVISTGSASDEVKVSINVAAPASLAVAATADVPSSWKFPFGVWIVAVYGAAGRSAIALPPPQVSDPAGPLSLLPVIVVVPEVIVNVALKLLGP